MVFVHNELAAICLRSYSGVRSFCKLHVHGGEAALQKLAQKTAAQTYFRNRKKKQTKQKQTTESHRSQHT